MKKWILVMVVLLTVCGCPEVYEQMGDPNSGLNIVVDTTEKLLPAVAAGGAVLPWGWIIGTVATAVSAVIGIYENYRKNIVIDEQDEDYSNLEETAAAVVKTIEVVKEIVIDEGTGETIGDAVKGRVEKELKYKEIYLIAKAIINGLKAK